MIASACGVGAASVGAEKSVVDKMKRVGELAGIAFQIKDDLFDYNDADVGKPTYIDIKEKKMTLPLIYTLNNCKSSVKRNLINTVKNKNEDKKAVKELVQIVIEHGGMKYAQQRMDEYHQQAISLLKELPDNQYRKGLQDLIAYTIERDK